MKKILLPLLLAALMSLNVQAQSSAKAEVQKTIETLFDGMRAGDSSMVASAFTRDAIMQTVATNREGKVIKSSGNLAQFLTAVGTPHDQVWDEKIASYDIKIDADLATAWTPYKFYAGENFSHCGVNSFQLAKLDGAWKIVYIVDTRRRDNCIE